MSYTTRDDAAAGIAEHLGLDRDAVREALGASASEYGRYEDLEGETLSRVERLVWDRVTGAAWPYGGES